MCDPKLRTPGIARSSLLTETVMRVIASSDVPGFSTQCMRKSVSLKSGRNSSPSRGTAMAVIANATATNAAAQRGRATSHGSIAR